MLTTPLNDTSRLQFFSKNEALSSLLLLKDAPSVVLVTLWRQWDSSDFQAVEPLIEKLLELGCMNFVCAGKCSESLHDFIDELILDMAIEDDNAVTFLTTWHNDETDGEVADFFLHSPSWPDGLRLAIFDNDCSEDQVLRQTITNVAEQKNQA